MYRIIVISDTHRHMDYALRVLDNLSEYDMIIHLGDYSADAARLERLYKNVTVVSVCGNNDFPSPSSPAEREIEIDGVKLFLTHGHKYGVKFGYERIYLRALELGAQVVLFGHTHVPICEKEDEVLMLNPGGYNSNSRGVGIIEIDDGKAKGCLYPC